MYKLTRKSANYPPHPTIPNASNPWKTISEHETLDSARMALDELLPSGMWVYGVFDDKGQVVE